MDRRFRIEFLPAATSFLSTMDPKAREKMYIVMRKSQHSTDAEVFKKINEYIWEFRLRHRGVSYRFFAFWDTRVRHDPLIIVTHGLRKKRARTPLMDIHRAIRARRQYLSA
jgi:phage-related protein